MSDHSELKKAAEDCEFVRGVELIGARVKFHAAATPTVVLQLIAEINYLRKNRTDWQAECLKLGFEYVRAPDDHYVLADVPEMARLLAQLLGVEVRDKENDSYGETISELHEQVEAGNNAFHRAYEAEAECDRLKEEVEALRKDAERYRWLRNGSDYSVAVHEGPELDKVIDRAMSEAAKP